MRSPSPLATPEPWNLVADGYVAENLAWFEAFAREALRLVPAEGHVLDVAAGPGSLTLLAARTARRVRAVDFAPAMLDALRSRAADAGLENVEPQVADGQALPFPAASFDAAYSMFGVIFFPDRARGLAELARVLRPGGAAVVSSWPPPERVPQFAAMFGAMAAELPGSGIGEAPTPLATAGEVTAELRAAGFAAVEVHERDVVTGTATPAELWRSFSRGGAPAVLMRKKMGEEAFAELSRRIVPRIEAALGPGPRELRLTALLGVGRR
jgi:ubiquinone/menaquinone biosynthesis C-methylase UbiE